MAGGKIDILVEPDTKKFGPKLEAGIKPTLGLAAKLGGAMGLAFAGAGVAGISRQIVETGNAYRKEMNSLQAVTQAGAVAMSQASMRARELGNDIDLPATSASDAAAAMTELAKGGFTLQESMDAAKGTLQLAAAAQIDAASAATIQAQALQAFGLSADYAATAADVLSGAANASSAEITGIAQGLQQAGTVANQFGISIEDTATSLAVFANAGIQGSDAGTLMKSALLALTDQGKPAQAAIKELGLTIYDAHGKFVGMSDLFDQLNIAAARMTDEQYQAATATLFGSDAMRLAGIAAQQGAEGFNRTRTAVTRAGQAAELAAAQTQGLPGAIEQVGNAWEETLVGVYEKIEGPLASALSSMAASMTDMAPVAESMATSTVAALGDVVGVVGGVVNAFGSLPTPIQHAGVALAGLKIAQHVGLIGSLQKSAYSTKEAFSTFGAQVSANKAFFSKMGHEINMVTAAMVTLEECVPAVSKMGDAYRNSAEKLGQLSRMHSQAATTAKAQWIAEKNLGTAIDHLGVSMGHTAAARATKFASVMRGSVSAAVVGARGAVMGLMSAFGGPWAVGLAAAGLAINAIVQDVKKTKRQLELLDEQTRLSQQAQRDFWRAVADGDSARAVQAMASHVDEIIAKQKELAETKPGWGSYAWLEAKSLFMTAGAHQDAREKLHQQKEVAQTAKEVAEAFDQVGLSSDEMAKAVTGSQESFDSLTGLFSTTQAGGQKAVDTLREQREAWQRVNREVENLAPGADTIAEAFEVIADSASSAQERIQAVTSVLDQMFGINDSADDAAAKLAEHIDDIADAALKTVDAADGFGQSLVGVDGRLDLSQKNARSMRQEIIGLRDELVQVGVTGGDVQQAWMETVPALEALGFQYGLTSEQVRQLAAEYSLMPSVIETIVSLDANEAKKDLAIIWAQADELENALGTPKEFRVTDVAKATDDLQALGFQVDVVNETTGQIKVTAETQEALDGLDLVINSALEVDQLQAGVKIDADTQEFSLGIQDVRALSDEIDRTVITPEVGLRFDELISGKQTTLAELKSLSEQVSDPKAKLVLDQLIKDKKKAFEYLEELEKKKTEPKIDADNKPLKNKVAESKRELDRLQDKTVTIRMREQRETTTTSSGSALSRRATGGRLPVTGPGTNVTDGFLGVDHQGTPIARVDAGEWVINRKSSEKYHGILHAINQGTFPAYATGGVVRSAAEIKKDLAVLDGTPYIMGGWSLQGTDCSGAVSAGVNAAFGLPILDSRMSTVTQGEWLAARGAVPGRGSSTDISIGWWDKGGGANGHTAMRLQDGTFVESGGNTGGGLTIGGAAGPLDGRGFEHFAYFPAEVPLVEHVVSSVGESTRGDANFGAASELHDLAKRYVGLYDNGGFLPHGGLALNLSGKPEPVFTAGQWSQLGQLVSHVGELVSRVDTSGGFFSHSQVVIDAEKGLAQTRKNIADEAIDLREKEEAIEQARKNLTKAERDAANSIADKEAALARARKSGKTDQIEKAERDLAKAREDAPDKAKAAADKIEKTEKELEVLREKSATAAKRLVAAERTVVASRFKAAADMVTSVGESLASSVGHIQGFFSTMADMAEVVQKTREEVSKLRMQQVTGALDLIKANNDVRISQWDTHRARVRGLVSVAQAEKELDEARKRQTKLGATSIEALGGAMDRFRQTGIFSIGEVASSVVEKSKEVRAAQWQVEVAKADAAVAQLEATHKQALAQLAVAEATVAQVHAAEMLKLHTAALAEQSAQLYGMSAGQARGAAAGFGGIGKVVGGLGKVAGGVLGALAGFAAGGPLGAIAGAGLALAGLKDTIQGGLDIHNNKKEIKESWQKLGAGQKAGVILGSLGGAALSVGGGALAGQLGADAATGGAKLADQLMDATIGSLGYGVESAIQASQRRLGDKTQAAQLSTEAQRAQIAAARQALEATHTAQLDGLSAKKAFAELQKQLVESSTKAEMQALAEAARLEAERMASMLDVAQQTRTHAADQLAVMRELVGAIQRQTGKSVAVDLKFTLPEGVETFSREQVATMLENTAIEVARKTREIEDANAYVDAKVL
ncbi:phage tail tape measure protein [Corynebacterium kutscheri]|uniref:phage tail tape measure protein n=1 Tax=Corynebacterium kutscheri TaxID=35755 RepID=UPI0037BFCA83